MQIARHDLYRIIAEEYLMSEGYWDHAGDDAAEELLKKIMGDKYEPPEKRGATRHITKGGDTAPMKKPHTGADDTMPFGPSDIPSDDAPERHVSGFQDRAGPPLEDQLMDLIQGLPPEEVVDLFQAVFEKVPGVELGDGEEELPPSPYSGQAIDQRTRQYGQKTGFEEAMALDGLVALIDEVMDTVYRAPLYEPPAPEAPLEKWEDLPDEQLVKVFTDMDPERLLAIGLNVDGRDGPQMKPLYTTNGELTNRDEMIAVLKNYHDAWEGYKPGSINEINTVGV